MAKEITPQVGGKMNLPERAQPEMTMKLINKHTKRTAEIVKILYNGDWIIRYTGKLWSTRQTAAQIEARFIIIN